MASDHDRPENSGVRRAPQTRLIHEGYDPAAHSGSVKAPIYHSSTFLFESAEQGAAFFRVNNKQALPGDPDTAGLMYSRFSTPNVDLLEKRLAVLDGGEAALAFGSGMAAIATALMTFAETGDVILHTAPLYGGTDAFLNRVLPRQGVQIESVAAEADEAQFLAAASVAIAKGPVRILYMESPTNPNNEVVDFALCRKVADHIRDVQGFAPILICDNTLLGPVGQQPLDHGVDLVVYSLTKYVGGHSDLLAGAVVGAKSLTDRIYSVRCLLGGVIDPHSAWLLTRSLETVTLRMKAACEGAAQVAGFLKGHPKVSRLNYPGMLSVDSRRGQLHRKQSSLDGSTFSFDVGDGRAAAFRFLDALNLIRLAVSLGGTESLILHPVSTSHSNVDPVRREALGYSESMVRLSVGLEDPQDLIDDLEQALANV
jgi:methionine-gamma-lyase